MSKAKHLLFDCDGVLVDTEYIAASKMVVVLNDLEVEISMEYFLRNHSGDTFSSILNRFVNDSLTQSEGTVLINRIEAEVAAEVKIITGVSEMLENVPTSKSVVSNSSVQAVINALEVTRIKHHFSSQIFSSELVKHPKPSPDIYLLAIKSLGYSIADILVIEDSLSGAKAALAAGLIVIGFTGASHILPGHGQNLIDIGVSRTVDNMQDLAVIINELT